MAFAQMYENARKRQAIFKDTLAYMEENDTLRAARDRSIEATRFFPADAEVDLTVDTELPGTINVVNNDSFGYARQLKQAHPELRVAVLNFASAYHAGGGVTRGARAQEESLCRTSTLYPAITTKKMAELYYKPNKSRVCENPGLQTDALIYTPNVIICRSQEERPLCFSERLPEKEFVPVDIITCAAPDMRVHTEKKQRVKDYALLDVSDEQLYDLHVSRAEHILSAAKAMGAEVVVLGAFGCGVFRNNPRVVARAYKDVLARYGRNFVEIAFPIPGGPNYEAFREVL